MRIKQQWLVGMLLFGGCDTATNDGGRSNLRGQTCESGITVHFRVEARDGGDPWDPNVGASEAPDPFGSVTLHTRGGTFTEALALRKDKWVFSATFFRNRTIAFDEESMIRIRVLDKDPGADDLIADVEVPALELLDSPDPREVDSQLAVAIQCRW